MSEVQKCRGWGGAHRFEGRYDLGPSTLVLTPEILDLLYDVLETLDAYRPEAYVYDICVRCGHVIRRP